VISGCVTRHLAEYQNEHNRQPDSSSTEGMGMTLSSRGDDRRHPRVTIPVHPDFLSIQAMLQRDTGITMTYGQVVNYLIHYYKTHPKAVPQSQWRAPDAKS